MTRYIGIFCILSLSSFIIMFGGGLISLSIADLIVGNFNMETLKGNLRDSFSVSIRATPIFGLVLFVKLLFKERFLKK